MRMCVCVCVCACVRACMCACVFVRVRVMCARVYVFACVHVFVYVHVQCMYISIITTTTTYINVYTFMIITTRGHITCIIITTGGPSIEHRHASKSPGSVCTCVDQYTGVYMCTYMCINVYTRIIITTRGHITCKVITTRGPSIEHGRVSELQGSCPLVWPFPSLQRPVCERETDTGRICMFHMTFSIVTNTCVCVCDMPLSFSFTLSLSLSLSLSLTDNCLECNRLLVGPFPCLQLPVCVRERHTCVRERETEGALVCTPQLFQKSQIPVCVCDMPLSFSLALSLSLLSSPSNRQQHRKASAAISRLSLFLSFCYIMRM